MSISIDVSGLKEMEKALKQIGESVGAKALRGALRDAGKPMLDDAISSVPKTTQVYVTGRKGQRRRVQPGRLKRSLKMRAKIDKNRHTAWVFVGTRAQGKQKDVYYAKWVEFGTRYAKPQPFLTPAMMRNEGRFFNLFKEKLAKRLKNAQRRAARATR